MNNPPMPIRAEGFPVATSDAYFQFPLCCLAYGPDHVKRLQTVVDWCIVHVAKEMKSIQAMTLAELQEHFKTINPDSLPGDMKKSCRDHLLIAAARRTLHISGGSIGNTLRASGAISEFVRKMETQHGRFPFVRMRADFIWDTIHGKMQYRDFAVLAGVYSVIGEKEFPVRITRQRITAAAMGYKSYAMLTPVILSAREDKAQPLTEKQLRRTLDTLEVRSLFARVQASKRRVYFSHRMTSAEMSEKILAVHVKRATKIARRRHEDRLLREKIADSIKVALPAQDGPRKGQTGAMRGPLKGHEKGHFNISSFIESSLIKTPLIEAGSNTAFAPASPPLDPEQGKKIARDVLRGLAKQEHPQLIPPPQERIDYWYQQFDPSKPGCKVEDLLKVVSLSKGNKVFDEARQRLSDEVIRQECAFVRAMREVNDGMNPKAMLIDRLNDRLKQ